MATVTLTRVIDNAQNRLKPAGPLTIYPATIEDPETGEEVYMPFKDANGDAPGLGITIEAGGILEVDDSKDYIKHNIELLELMVEQGVLPFGLSIEKASQRVQKNANLRAKRREAEDAVNAFQDDDQAIKSLGIRLGLAVMDSMTKQEVLDLILDQCDTMPDKVLTEINNPDQNIFMIVQAAQKKLVITLAPQGEMFFNNYSLGFNVPEAVNILNGNPMLLAGIQNALSVKNIPSRTAPQAALADAIAEQARLDEMMENGGIDTRQQKSKVYTVEELIQLALTPKISMIKAVGTGPGGKNTKYMYKGFEIGKSLEEVAIYLNENEGELDLLRKLTA